MNKHLVLVTDPEFKNIVSGEAEYLVKFFKKRSGMVSKIAVGDLVYFKKSKGEVSGQFEIGKTINIERVEIEDWETMQQFLNDFTRELFEKKTIENSTMVIVKIEKLEQFITSPIDVPKGGRKEWVVLGN